MLHIRVPTVPDRRCAKAVAGDVDKRSRTRVPVKGALASRIIEDECRTAIAEQGGRDPALSLPGPPLCSRNVALCQRRHRIANQRAGVCSFLADGDSNGVGAISNHRRRRNGIEVVGGSVDNAQIPRFG